LPRRRPSRGWRRRWRRRWRGWAPSKRACPGCALFVGGGPVFWVHVCCGCLGLFVCVECVGPGCLGLCVGVECVGPGTAQHSGAPLCCCCGVTASISEMVWMMRAGGGSAMAACRSWRCSTRLWWRSYGLSCIRPSCQGARARGSCRVFPGDVVTTATTSPCRRHRHRNRGVQERYQRERGDTKQAGCRRQTISLHNPMQTISLHNPTQQPHVATAVAQPACTFLGSTPPCTWRPAQPHPRPRQLQMPPPGVPAPPGTLPPAQPPPPPAAPRHGASSHGTPPSPPPPPSPIDAPCTQGLRHGDPLHARKQRLTAAAPSLDLSAAHSTASASFSSSTRRSHSSASRPSACCSATRRCQRSSLCQFAGGCLDF
jgi:hypothetical protein